MGKKESEIKAEVKMEKEESEIKAEVKMEKEESDIKAEIKAYSAAYKIQSYFNIFNHILNGAVACFMTLYLIREAHDSFSLHVFLTTIGYQVLMAEAIMVYYIPNSWSYFLSHRTKKHLHWILHSIGAIFIITGNIIISLIRTTPHFKTIHAVTGKVGGLD